MNHIYSDYVQKHLDILSLRDLAPGTISTYISYLNEFLNWVTKELPGKDLPRLTFEEIRSYMRYLKDIRGLNNRTINVHIAQLRDFFLYVLHRDWDRYQVPYLRFDQYLSRCGDIVASKNCIYVSRSKNRSDRYAVLSSKALGLLNSYIYKDYRSASKDSWLFPGQKDGSHICTQTVYNILQKQLAVLGWQGKGYSCHSLRNPNLNKIQTFLSKPFPDAGAQGYRVSPHSPAGTKNTVPVHPYSLLMYIHCL